MEPTVNDITKAAFLSGYPAENWLAVVQQLKPHGPSAVPASEICASIFNLLEAYPLSPVLLQYLCVALDSESPNPVLPIGIYISALIAWSQTILASPTDQTTQLLSALCALAAPRVQKPSVNLSPTLPTAQGCISLVQHVSHLHDALLTSSALELLLAILRTVVASPPNPNLSPALALNLVPGINDLLNEGEIVSPQLTNWLFQLSALTVDGLGPSRVSQPVTDESPLRPELLEFSKNGSLFDVLAYQLTTVLAYPGSHLFGLQTVYNAVQGDSFFSQLYLSLISILANEPDGNTRLIIRAALFGSLPALLCQLEPGQAKLKEGVQLAINGLLARYGALLDKCDATAPITRAREDSMEEDVPEDGSKGKTIRTMLVQSLQSVSLLDSNLPSAGLTIENWPGRGMGRVFAEAGENGQELEAYLRSKLLSLDLPLSDKLELIDRAVVDPETHACLCTVLHKVSTLSPHPTPGMIYPLAASTQHLSPATLESLAHLSRLLYSHSAVLDIVGLRVPPTELVAAGLAFLEDWEGAGVGDPQSALGQYGDVLLLLQLLVTRYELKSGTLKHGDRVLDASYLTSSWAVYHLSDLNDSERTLINDWVKAVFDPNSGIDDNILRSTNPRVLLKLSATLFTEAIRKCAAEPEGAGMEILRNGVSYFEGPLLNWTLRGVIWALANEAERHGHAAQTHLDILQLLVLANGCPAPVIEMTRHRVLRLLASRYIPKANIDVNAMLRVLHPSNAGPGSTSTTLPLFASSYLNLALQASIAGTPIPNPARILSFTSPLELLRAPVQQGSDSVAHRNIVIAVLTLAQPRFAGIKYVLSALRSLAGTMDADFLAGVVAGSISVWIATPSPSERALARDKVKRFVSEGEKEKGLDGIVKRMMGVEAVKTCVASD
ncbi:E3 ubiquitin-protein ligase HERC2 [Rhizoctonia solani]|uniref:Mediator of RNA polymerase II transcription subunit 5 n=1 Tax=Rhizoctonia solani TaxID=456999 RepID=A0A0K6G6W4_9AGAM|nr:E3 ubiquitin-protein ligase HERC2 [Rhizoctonia solani]